MGNCLSTLQECADVIRKRNRIRGNHENDYLQRVLKRILLLEEKTAEQEFNIRMMKMQLCHLEIRRLADKRKISSLGKSVVKVQETLGKTRSVSLQEMDNRIYEIEDIIKELRIKVEVHGTMLRELHKKQHHGSQRIDLQRLEDRMQRQDDEGRLIGVLEQGIKEGKKHLENLEELFKPVRLLMDSDNSIRQLMKNEEYSIKKTQL